MSARFGQWSRCLWARSPGPSTDH
ncbi:uncharacterized protein ACO6RY_12993 [Pungitius sinensis]